MGFVVTWAALALSGWREADFEGSTPNRLVQNKKNFYPKGPA
jgi:hypothetical protein